MLDRAGAALDNFVLFIAFVVFAFGVPAVVIIGSLLALSVTLGEWVIAGLQLFLNVLQVPAHIQRPIRGLCQLAIVIGLFVFIWEFIWLRTFFRMWEDGVMYLSERIKRAEFAQRFWRGIHWAMRIEKMESKHRQEEERRKESDSP